MIQYYQGSILIFRKWHRERNVEVKHFSEIKTFEWGKLTMFEWIWMGKEPLPENHAANWAWAGSSSVRDGFISAGLFHSSQSPAAMGAGAAPGHLSWDQTSSVSWVLELCLQQNLPGVSWESPPNTGTKHSPELPLSQHRAKI